MECSSSWALSTDPLKENYHSASMKDGDASSVCLQLLSATKANAEQTSKQDENYSLIS